MANSSIKEDLIAQIDGLPLELQRRLLNFAKSLTLKGVAGESLLRFEGAITAEDLRQMSKAIEEDCERVDVSEW